MTSAVCCGGGDGCGGGSSQQMWQSGFRICNLKGNFITCSVILFTSCLIQIQCFHCLHTDASECNFIGFPSSCNLKISSWLQRGKILKSVSNNRFHIGAQFVGKVTMYASFFENLHCKLNENLEFRSFEMNFRSCLSYNGLQWLLKETCLYLKHSFRNST